MESKYLTIEEVAEKIQVSTRTIRTWIKQGFPAIKVGNILRFDEARINEWLNSQSKN